ncbi:MAG TPA: sel1 repeat family protein, partial [Phycisphaerales bacterium]|nr:sel1 repeat family protein [Phycisphaerales bacterium]
KWFLEAAEQGLASAQANLGRMYLQGEGVSKNYDEAFKWYEKAAEQGDAHRQFMVGDMYIDGSAISVATFIMG